MTPFFVLGTPRSRTAWLAKFLSIPGRPCLHEPSRLLPNWAAFQQLAVDEEAAVSDSLLTYRWRDILRLSPDCRIVVVHRPLDQVRDSFARQGYQGAALNRRLFLIEQELHRLSLEAPVLAVPFRALATRHACGLVFEHCHRRPMPVGHWERWHSVIVTANIPEVAEAMTKNWAGVLNVYPELAETA